MIKSFSSVVDARNYCANSDLYTCEFLFDDWHNIDKLLADEHIFVVYCRPVYPNGVWDRRYLHKNIVTSDIKHHHFPAVRVICTTHSVMLYNNIYRSIGISYRDGKYCVMFTYQMLQECKEHRFSKVYFLRMLKRQLAETYYYDNTMICKLIGDERWWKAAEEQLIEEETRDYYDDVYFGYESKMGCI